MEIDKAVGAIKQIARLVGVLICKQVCRRALGFGGRGDSRARQHFGNEFHALAMILAGKTLRNGFFKESVGAFRNTARRFPRRRVAIDFSSRRIRSLLVNPGFSKRERIRIGRVAAAMFDVYGMVRDSGVQVGNVERAAFFRFRVVVFEAEHPFSRWRFRGAFAKRSLNRRNRAQVAVHHAEMHQSGLRGMRMRVDEAGRDRLPAKIDFS